MDIVFIAGRDPRSHPECAHCIYVRTHARAATRAGHATHLILLGPRPAREEADYGTLHVAATRRTTHRQNRIPWFSGTLADAAAKVVRSLGNRAVILHGMGVWGHAAARADEMLGGKRALVLSAYTTHADETASQWRGLGREAGWAARMRIAFELSWSRAVVSRYEAVALRRARRVLVNYRSVQRLIERRHGVESGIVPYTVEPELLEPGVCAPPARARAPGPTRIVCVARHDPRKGIDVLLRALLGLRQAGVSFSAKLIGGGPRLAEHRRFADTLGLGGGVDILGVVPRVEPFLDEADIFVLPSREEQSGSLALIEAMRAGLPCVASGCDGIPEDVRHLDDAWIVAPGDPRALAGALGALIADSALRERLGAGARRQFERRFPAGAMVTALDRVYGEVLAEARSAGAG